MTSETVTLQVPADLYQRLVHTARATQRSLEEVLLHSLRVGSPPGWDDVPPEYRAELAGSRARPQSRVGALAALDPLDDAGLWTIARGHKSATELARYDELLERNRDGGLSPVEREELQALRAETERFMLRKAQAAVLLRWRGHQLPPP